MPIQPFNPTYPFTDEKLAQLRQIVPEAFEDGRLNFETLREVLEPNLEPGGTVTDDSERFGLLWPGKKEARRLAAIPSKGTLAPVYGQGLKADGTPDTDGHNDSRNVFIEGENLEVLKIMQKAYAGRVKMIYIDPPYNTGNDFVYDDNFTEPLEHYLRRTGQIDDEGQKLTTNTKADGRFHSKWLSMMYPRLRLARNLLREDGVIFVSINDAEYSNLAVIMKEIFGEENYVASIVWQSKKGGGSDSNTLVSDHEYVILFSKSIDQLTLGGIEITAEPLDKVDHIGAYRKGRELNKWGANSRRIDRPTMWYPIPGPEGAVFPIKNDGTEGCWRYGKQSMQKIIDAENIEFEKRDDGTYIAYEKIRSTESRFKPYRTWLSDTGTTADGSKSLKELFDGQSPFSFAKPINLISTLIEISGADNDIVLDFFAGSNTTAAAVVEINQVGQKNLQFITIQIPESVESSTSAGQMGYDKISTISQDRISRVISKKGVEGFKKYQLEKSNFESNSVSTLSNLFDQVESPKTYNPATLLWEVALNEGFPLDSRVETREVAGQTIQTLTSEFHDFALHCCFDSTIAPAAAPEITLGENDVLVCLDSALDDQTKLRLSDKGLLKTI